MLPARLSLLLAQANARLTEGGFPVQIALKGSNLCLRATLPAKDDPARRLQQRIALRRRISPMTIPEAEVAAARLGRELITGTFSWAAWGYDPAPPAAPAPTRESLTAQVRAYLEARYSDSLRLKNAWRQTWGYALRHLPDGPLDPAALLKTVEALPARSRRRRAVGYSLAKAAELEGWDPKPIRAAGRGYGVRCLTPRDIPEDEEILRTWAAIPAPHWRWGWAVLATYGLRPSELYDVEFDSDYNALVADDTKTGSRLVWPRPEAWVEQMGIREICRPRSIRLRVADSMRLYLKRKGIEQVGLYVLRHAYAVRLLKAGVPADLGARLMGHSITQHEHTYRRWTTAQTMGALRRQYQ